MPLPALIDYTTTLLTVPTSRADWQLEADRTVVLVHDLQQYFIRPFAPECSALKDALTATATILDAARRSGVPVVYTAQSGDQPASDRGLQGDLWGRGMTAQVDDTRIVEAVAPRPDEDVLAKHRYSAFAKSDLAVRLDELQRDQMIITGVYAHVGIVATALDAFQREIQPFVVADGVADFGLAEHQRALHQVASCCGVVTSATDVVQALTPVEAASGDGWEAELRRAMRGLLPDAPLVTAFTTPDTDLFALGLDSMRAFELLDRLLDLGIDVDYADFTQRPTASFLLEQGALLSES